MARPSGSANRNKRFLLARLQDMYGEDFHPIMQMASNCVELQRQVDGTEDPEAKREIIKLANAEWYRIAEFTEPKLKAIEHDLSDDLKKSHEEWLESLE